MGGNQWSPIAIGGVGGSGTRVLASLFRTLGYYLGDDLNKADDNLWFTLLFMRRSVLLEDAEAFFWLSSLFFRRMRGAVSLTEEERSRISRLADHDRLQHRREWLAARVASFCSGQSLKGASQPWGWKEPNSHVVIGRILRCHSDLRYVHVYRHPLDMAASRNQNQLKNWGPIFLDRNEQVTPGSALTYWCTAHRRVVALAHAQPERVLLVNFDALCLAPEDHAARIAAFAGVVLSDTGRARFGAYCRAPASTGRFHDMHLSEFDPADLAYLAEIGYPIGAITG
jgi:hypothetical protein